MSVDRAALIAGGIRLASGVSFLIDPVRANRLWGDPDEPVPTARLLLRSMGYRDALIGGLLTAAALRGNDTRGWFLASAGADGADLLGGVGVHHEMKRSQRVIGLGGAVIGIAVGLWGATRKRETGRAVPSDWPIVDPMSDLGARAGIDPRHHDAVLFDLKGPVLASAGTLARRLEDAGLSVATVSADRQPTILAEAARRLGARPGRAVVITGTEAGVAAARASGFGLVIGVATESSKPGGLAAALSARGADAIVGEPARVAVYNIDRRMSGLPDALARSADIDAVLAVRRPAFFFDFDGTLSTIVDQPGTATLVDGAAEALRALAALYPVAVLSGRDLADIVDRVGIPGLWYAGSHGFEILCPDGTNHSNEAAAQAIPVLERAAAELTEHLRADVGVSVEHKRYAVAVHFRNAGPDAASTVTAAVHDVGKRNGLRVTSGRKVVELRPDVDWDKGKTLQWIAGEMTGDGALLPIFVGDDLTDEDAFDAVLNDGIGIVVRHSEDGDRATAARYCLDDPRRVREFIDKRVRSGPD